MKKKWTSLFVEKAFRAVSRLFGLFRLAGLSGQLFTLFTQFDRLADLSDRPLSELFGPFKACSLCRTSLIRRRTESRLSA